MPRCGARTPQRVGLPVSAGAVKEERRPPYVAMTRAKDHLHLILPQRFFAYQQRAPATAHVHRASQALYPVLHPQSLDNCVWPKAPTIATVTKASRERVDITSRLRRMWSDAGSIIKSPSHHR
jgi:DNA helicase-2/ATP-dependent DNA helicase PcrA